MTNQHGNTISKQYYIDERERKKSKSWELLDHAINSHFRVTNLKFVVFNAKFFLSF